MARPTSRSMEAASMMGLWGDDAGDSDAVVVLTGGTVGTVMVLVVDVVFVVLPQLAAFGCFG